MMQSPVYLIDVENVNSNIPQIYTHPLTLEMSRYFGLKELTLDKNYKGDPETSREYYPENENAIQEYENLKNITTYILSITRAFENGMFGRHYWERKEHIMTRICSQEIEGIRLKGLKGFVSFLNKESENPSKIYFKNWITEFESLISALTTNSDEEKKQINTLPYKIALLNEIGFFEMPLIKNLTKNKQREILKKLTGGTDRQLKGNISVLNPKSQDDRIRYTSFAYEEDVKKFLSTLNDK